jgi:hypothetical protein
LRKAVLHEVKSVALVHHPPSIFVYDTESVFLDIPDFLGFVVQPYWQDHVFNRICSGKSVAASEDVWSIQVPCKRIRE